MTEGVYEGKLSNDGTLVATKSKGVWCKGCDLNFDWSICKKNTCIHDDGEGNLTFFIWIKRSKHD